MNVHQQFTVKYGELVRILNKAYSLTYDADDYLDNL